MDMWLLWASRILLIVRMAEPAPQSTRQDRDYVTPVYFLCPLSERELTVILHFQAIPTWQ